MFQCFILNFIINIRIWLIFYQQMALIHFSYHLIGKNLVVANHMAKLLNIFDLVHQPKCAYCILIFIEEGELRISFLLSISKDVIPPPVEDAFLGSFFSICDNLFVCLNCCSCMSLILQRMRIVLKNQKDEEGGELRIR